MSNIEYNEESNRARGSKQKKINERKKMTYDEHDEDYAFNKALENYEQLDENENPGNEAVRFMRDPKTQILTKDNAASLVGRKIRWTFPTYRENSPTMHEGKIVEIKDDRIVMEESENDGKPFRHEWIFLNYEGIFCCSDEDRYVHFQAA